MNRVLVATALTAGMALLGAQAARADAMTQNFYFPEVYGYNIADGTPLAGFDSTLGTLTSVAISDSVTATWTGGLDTDRNRTGYDLDVILTLQTTAANTGPGAASAIFSVTDTDSSALSAFTTASTITPEVIMSQGGPDRASLISIFGIGTLTYNYTPATTSVPEPGSLALLGTALIGLGAIGFSRRRRG